MRMRARRDAGWTVEDAPYFEFDAVPESVRLFKNCPPPPLCEVFEALPVVTAKTPEVLIPSACMNQSALEVRVPVMFGASARPKTPDQVALSTV